MTMNKFIHPRNIYKKHPDFTELSRLYPEFRAICTVDENGKAAVNFQDETTISILTKCLLHKDFQLHVDFPTNRLIPTLPLRLNYILWIEDVLEACGLANAPRGIDIGCGASCIYPLLATKKNGQWQMTGVEVDPASYESAKSNVAKNGLEDRITLVLQSHDSGIFDQIFSEDTSSIYDFCVCNPPFYDDSTSSVPKNRTGNRPPPRNAKTGSQVELSCGGGEVQFIKKIISGSLKYRSRIRVFTTMIGIKNDVSVLVKELRRLGVTNYVETEFCQGRTTRWGLAWSFDEECFYLRTVPCIKSTFSKEPAIFYIPEMNASQMEQKGVLVEENLLRLLADIEIKPQSLPATVASEKRWRIKLRSVTWTNARRRRRGHVEESEVPAKRVKLDDEVVVPKIVLVADIYLNTVANGHTLQIFYLDGSHGKDACQQILQYVINNFNKLF